MCFSAPSWHGSGPMPSEVHAATLGFTLTSIMFWRAVKCQWLHIYMRGAMYPNYRRTRCSGNNRMNWDVAAHSKVSVRLWCRSNGQQIKLTTLKDWLITHAFLCLWQSYIHHYDRAILSPTFNITLSSFVVYMSTVLMNLADNKITFLFVVNVDFGWALKRKRYMLGAVLSRT